MTISALQLVPIDLNGTASGYERTAPSLAGEILLSTVKLYQSTGFVEPWIGYLGVIERNVIGTCGFKSPPVAGRVEIAYFTFPEHEGQGLATQMAARLTALARRTDDTVLIAAQTLPVRNASHRILEKLGFQCIGELEHPEDGTVLEWQLPRNP